MNIIGVSGRDRSGKDTVAELCMQAGYYGVSFGDITREHSFKRHANEPDPISVKNMTETSNWLRETRGPDVILQEALKRYESARQAKEYKGLVLYSLRAPVEADFVLKHGGELIWVEASDEVRYERKIANIRDGETKVTFQEMLQQEALQADPQPGIPHEVQMDLNYVKSRATKIIKNNGNDVEAFKVAVKKALNL